MHNGLWEAIRKITLKTSVFGPITFDEVYDTTSAFAYTNNLLELMFFWKEAQPDSTSGASRITSLENFKYNFEKWRYIKEYNQLMGARWTVKTDLRQEIQFFAPNITTSDFEDRQLKIFVGFPVNIGPCCICGSFQQ